MVAPAMTGQPVFLSDTRAALSAVTQFLCPDTELVLECEVVAAGHSLEQSGARERFGGEVTGLPRTGQASPALAASSASRRTPAPSTSL
ncbi:hypothetical protein IQ64_38790 [Streptomyces stelliscabiei]|nr:hypothetical protein IQ64_38790 [Streptomyces stelliscabiei]